MIVDINAFYGNWPYWPLRKNSVCDMLAAMDRYGIRRAFLASLRAIFTDTQAGNAEIKEICKEHPERFAPAFTYSPYAAGFDEYQRDLEEAGSWALVKLYPLNHSYDLLEEPFISELCEYCGTNRVPVMIPYRLMMSWRLPMHPIQNAGRLIEKHSNTTFILSAVNYLFELQSALDVIRRLPNVMLETSGMMAFEEVKSVVHEIGSERLLHGSALPLQNPAIGPLKIHSADIADSDKDRILFQNACGLFDKSAAS